jgi:hypothetical protein
MNPNQKNNRPRPVIEEYQSVLRLVRQYSVSA